MENDKSKDNEVPVGFECEVRHNNELTTSFMNVVRIYRVKRDITDINIFRIFRIVLRYFIISWRLILF